MSDLCGWSHGHDFVVFSLKILVLKFPVLKGKWSFGTGWQPFDNHL